MENALKYVLQCRIYDVYYISTGKGRIKNLEKFNAYVPSLLCPLFHSTIDTKRPRSSMF